MLRLVLFSLPAALATIAAGQAVIPPGYEGIIDITTDTVADNLWPSMNNRGQIVWSRRSDPLDDLTAEIFLYDNGNVTQLTDDYVRDAYPDINDAGVIVWSRGIGSGGTMEIVRCQNGVITRLTSDAYSDYRPRINENGRIAWCKWTGGGCQNSDCDIYLYNGTTVKRITFGGSSQQSPDLNELDDVVWTRYNFCHSPWTSTIMVRYADGTIEALTDDTGADRVPTINNARLVVWLGDDPPLWEDHIHLYQEGVTTTLTPWGSASYLNNCGDIAFNRWHPDSQTWQVWLYRQGQFYQITSDPFWSFAGAIDDVGNVVFLSGDDYMMMTNLHLLNRLPLGDLNCDGAVNAFDIDAFVSVLVDPSEYQAQYADCDATLADLNLDGSVNVFDIDPFVDALTR
jgi:hypothetical protein